MGAPAIAGVGLSALGTGMQMRNRNKAIKAANREYEQEYGRQSGYREQGGELFNKSLGNFERPAADERRQEAIDRRSAASDEAVAGAEVANPISGQPRVVQEAFSREIAKALDTGKDFGRRMAPLGAVGDTSTANNILMGRGDQDIARLMKEAGNSARIAPIAANAAFNNRFNPLPGALVQGIGQLGMNYGFSRPGLNPYGTSTWPSQSGPRKG